mmetsp:Transcript_13795/g.24621  ORF Transcript_13795/g.24621 Transcript_13795/m.24621 type:complete len:321 (-) Transcript_13795:32-994(-)
MAYACHRTRSEFRCQHVPKNCKTHLLLGGAALLSGGTLSSRTSSLLLLSLLGSLGSSVRSDTVSSLLLSSLNRGRWAPVVPLLVTDSIGSLGADGVLDFQRPGQLMGDLLHSGSILTVGERHITHGDSLGGSRGTVEIDEAVVLGVHTNLGDTAAVGEVRSQLLLGSCTRKATNEHSGALTFTNLGRTSTLGQDNGDLVALDQLLVHLQGLVGVGLSAEEDQSILAVAKTHLSDVLAVLELLLHGLVGHALEIQTGHIDTSHLGSLGSATLLLLSLLGLLGRGRRLGGSLGGSLLGCGLARLLRGHCLKLTACGGRVSEF